MKILVSCIVAGMLSLGLVGCGDSAKTLESKDPTIPAVETPTVPTTDISSTANPSTTQGDTETDTSDVIKPPVVTGEWILGDFQEDIAPQGGTGGEAFSSNPAARCSDNALVKSIFLKAGWLLDAIGIACGDVNASSVSLSRTQVTASTTRSTRSDANVISMPLSRTPLPPAEPTYIGGNGGKPEGPLTPPSGSVFTGFNMKVCKHSNGNDVIGELNVEHKPLTQVLKGDDPTSHTYFGPFGVGANGNEGCGDWVASRCPAGSVLVGIKGQAGSVIDQLGVVCKKVSSN